DYTAGEMFWDAPSSWSLDRMLRNNQHVGAVKEWMQEYLGNGSWVNVLFENTTVGSLSTDGKRVYVVEDFIVPPYPDPPFRLRPGGFDEKLSDAHHHNRLEAYELESGKLMWEVGAKARGKVPKPLED